MIESELQEQKHLKKVQGFIAKVIKYIDLKISGYEKEIKEDIKYYGEGRHDMDHIEKMSLRQLIASKLLSTDQMLEYKKRVQRLSKSPYFGRFDFQMKGENQAEKIYVGVHNFFYESEKRPVIYDWRAPISSIFYEHESGTASYEAPSGIIEGEVLLKRQFRIQNGEMEFMLDSAMNITDDVLQKELSRTSDDAMKNIVATIQRAQNLIIRNEESDVLIIQGVAGSGKTSIALHRIAFLLYRFKETLTSEDVLIISPNGVFANYISNVLPELGEESVGEIQMEHLAKELLGDDYPFQTFFEQTTELLEKNDAEMRQRIEIKSSPEFLRKIEAYAEHLQQKMLLARDIWIDGYMTPHWVFEEVFQSFHNYPKKECIQEMTEIISSKMENEYRIEFETRDKRRLKKEIEKMHQGEPLHQAYKKMFAWLKKPELFEKRSDGSFEYTDVFPMIYLKMHLEKVEMKTRPIKHLLIDEMQDYTSVQYAVIARLFPCKKTILGDINQSINPYSSTDGNLIREFFKESIYMELNKSYRSSYEIMQFAQSISPNTNLEPIERHGEVPLVLACKDKEDELGKIVNFVKEFSKTDYNTLGIICKTQAKAEEIFQVLLKNNIVADLLTADSTEFKKGIIICTAHMSKGLEFDHVIAPELTAENYHTEMEKHLLYVACTRAMHKLTLTYVGTMSKFVKSKLVKG